MSLTQEQLQEMWNWYQARKEQFIPYPLDPNSVASLDVAQITGTGAAPAKQTLSADLVSGAVANVPGAPVGTLLLKSGGVTYKIPYSGTV